MHTKTKKSSKSEDNNSKNDIQIGLRARRYCTNSTRNADKTIKHNKISAMISKVCLSCCENKECESEMEYLVTKFMSRRL